MAGSWQNQINFIADGEDVNAQVSGRPDRNLADRTQYLKDRLDALAFGEGVFAYGVSVDADVEVGQPVYFNGGTGSFSQALAGLSTTADGVLVPTLSSDVIGIVYDKPTATTADVLLNGKAAIDISAAVIGSVVAGRYYLSGSTPGKLTLQNPGVSVAVLFADGAGNVFVQPQLRDLAESHVHYRFNLFIEPAGTTIDPGQGDRHFITDADPTRPGWLPAGDSSFQGLAPDGAVFGYNLAQHPELERVWPPLPEEAASISLFLGDATGYGYDLPTGKDGLVLIDRNGIWWMSDCYGDVPWSTLDNTSVSSSISSYSPPECPRQTQRRLVLSFARVRYALDKSVVTSLKPAPESPITLVGCSGQPASTGDLQIDLDTTFMVASDTDVGSLVFKNLNGTKFTRGNVIEGILAANDTVTISSTVTRPVDPADLSSPTLYQGIVSIAANVAPAEQLLQPSFARLLDARERYEQGNVFLGLPAGYNSGVRYKFKLPGPDNFPAGALLKLRLWLFGDTDGTLPSLTLAYRQLYRPLTATTLPVTDTSLTIVTAISVVAEDYIEIDSATFGVDDSTEVTFLLQRSASDGYVGEVAILDAVAVLAPA